MANWSKIDYFVWNDNLVSLPLTVTHKHKTHKFNKIYIWRLLPHSLLPTSREQRKLQLLAHLSTSLPPHLKYHKYSNITAGLSSGIAVTSGEQQVTGPGNTAKAPDRPIGKVGWEGVCGCVIWRLGPLKDPSKTTGARFEACGLWIEAQSLRNVTSHLRHFLYPAVLQFQLLTRRDTK